MKSISRSGGKEHPAYRAGFAAARRGDPLDTSRPEREYFDGYYTGEAANRTAGELSQSDARMALADELLRRCNGDVRFG